MKNQLIKPPGLFKPTRRKLLTGIAALSAARVLGDLAEARPIRGGISNPSVAPSQASAVGYNSRTFFSDFTSLSEVDVNDTRAAGYKWYVHNTLTGGDNGTDEWLPTPASCFNQSGTILNCGPTVPVGLRNGNNGALMSTAAQDPMNSAAWIGQTFIGGYYAECSLAMQMNNPGNPPCPAFWSFPIEAGIQAGYFPYVELDYMEHVVNGNSNLMNLGNAWEAVSSPPWTAYGINNAITLSGDLTQQNVYGCLNVPMSQNGGTGLVKYYYNDALMLTISYTASGAPSPNFSNSHSGSLSEIDIGHYFLILGWQNVGTIAVDWVKVWQL